MPEYRFDEIAINSKEKKKPTEADKDTYIGLEHLDTGSLKVSRWGSEVAPTGEKLVMHKGDVLFGKRRAYQKKVAIAPFDGIFSAHGMVLRPQEAVITKDYFPLFISSDYFLDAAIKISVGSLSPTINWSDLKELTFQIPTIEEQKRLAPVIWAAIDTKNAYKKLLLGIDELVKSQFIEMFDNIEGAQYQTLEKCCKSITGGNFIHFCSMSVPVMLVEVVVRLGYALKRIKEGHRVKDSIPFSLNRDDHPKLATMLFIGQAGAAAINAGKVYFTKNPMAINYPQWIAFAKYSYSQLKWAVVNKPEQRELYISGRLSDDLAAVVVDVDDVFSDYSKDYIVVFE